MVASANWPIGNSCSINEGIIRSHWHIRSINITLNKRGRSFLSWLVLLGCIFFYFDPINLNLFANEHKLVLVSGAVI